MKPREFHDDEESLLVAAYDRGEFKPVKDQKMEKGIAVAAAKRYRAKSRGQTSTSS